MDPVALLASTAASVVPLEPAVGKSRDPARAALEYEYWMCAGRDNEPVSSRVPKDPPRRGSFTDNMTLGVLEFAATPGVIQTAIL